MNPRVVLWLRATGLTPADIARVDGETARLDGTLWTVRYSEWVRNRWQEWAEAIGHTDRHDAALHGHTAEQFDAWLKRSVGPFRIGQTVLDPMNRRVTVIAHDGDEVTVRMGVFDLRTARYPASCLTTVETVQ